MEHILKNMTSKFPLTLIDCDGDLDIKSEVLKYVDRYLVLFAYGDDEQITEELELVRQAKTINPKLEVFGVLSRMPPEDPPEESDALFYIADYGLELAPVRFSCRFDYTDARNNGTYLDSCGTQAKAAAELSALIEWLPGELMSDQ